MSGGVTKAANKADKKKKVLRCLMQFCTEIKLYSIQNMMNTGICDNIDAIIKRRKVKIIKS
jgi:hypothetical protein